jgi:hypothetical protein
VCAFAVEARTEISKLEHSPKERASITGLDPNGYNWLALRSAPSFGASWSTTHLIPGTIVTVLGREGEWTHIQLDGGETGWANSRYLTPTGGAPPSLSPEPSSMACGGNSDAQITRPIRMVYQAINKKDVDLYSTQWSDDGIYRDLFSGIVQNKAQRLDNRRQRFATWELINLTMDKNPDVKTKNDGHATIEVTYTMTFKEFGKSPFRRSGVVERYEVVCGAAGNWIIQENIDETNVR